MSSVLLLLILHASPPPALRPLAVMSGGGIVHVTVATPAGMHWPGADMPRNAILSRVAMELAARPRLEGAALLEWIAPDPGERPTLEFVGKVTGRLPERMRLRYHEASGASRSVEVRLDDVKPTTGRPATMRMLWRRAMWQRAQADEVLSGGLGYFAALRRELAPTWDAPDVSLMPADGSPSRAGLLELTTGAASLDEAIALGRAAGTDHLPAHRSLSLGRLREVAIADHPWKELMRGERPAAEPLAGAVPHDHWYLTVRRLATLAEMADIIEAWGSPLRLVQMNERDHRLMERYQTELCLPIRELAKDVPPRLIRGVALTGSDLFWAEGTDITVIVDTPDPKALLQAIDAPLARARKRPGFQEGTREHGEIRIEAYSTADGAVSLFRAVAGGKVICSNSIFAMRRVLDTVAGDRRSLRSSPDFRYMRTAFVKDDKEDGFAFLSDDFIRAMVSPEMRVKAIRRVSSRAAMTRVSHAALVYASRHGRLPEARDDMEDARLLEPGKPVDARGEVIRWEGGEAVSPTHGTLSRGYPLIGYTVTNVTPAERDAYEEFRRGYTGQWQQFIDPVGIRLEMRRDAIRVEAYMLPLSRSEAYQSLRRATGGRQGTWDPAALSPRLAAQVRFGDDQTGLAIQIDDSPDLPAWAAHLSTRLHYPERRGRAGLRVPPVAAGFLVPRPAEECCQLVAVVRAVVEAFVPTIRVSFRAEDHLSGSGLEGWLPGPFLNVLREESPGSVYTSMVGAARFVAFHEEAIDARIAARKAGASQEGPPAAAAFFLTRKRPGMAAALELLLEKQVHRKALAANVMWRPLYEAGLVTPKMTEAERRQVALRLWGFVPAAPDGSAVSWDEATRLVRNARHGTWQTPSPHASLDARSALARFIRGMESLSAELRFREDGIHTTITFKRAGK
jgi:hypothetical protein